MPEKIDDTSIVFMPNVNHFDQINWFIAGYSSLCFRKCVSTNFSNSGSDNRTYQKRHSVRIYRNELVPVLLLVFQCIFMIIYHLISHTVLLKCININALCIFKAFFLKKSIVHMVRDKKYQSLPYGNKTT